VARSFFSRASERIPPPEFLQRLLAACRRMQQKNDIGNIFTTTTRLATHDEYSDCGERTNQIPRKSKLSGDFYR
jgi:hypothetical protein